MYFVYILWCSETGRTYVGQTEDLVQRYRRHREGSTRTTREKLRQPVVMYWESHPTRADAVKRERYFKAGAGHRAKVELVEQARRWFVG